MYKIVPTSAYRKAFKLCQKRGRDMDKLKAVIATLAAGEKLPPENRDHALVGNYVGCRECHVEPNWLLIYQLHNDRLILSLVGTGTHSDLF